MLDANGNYVYPWNHGEPLTAASLNAAIANAATEGGALPLTGGTMTGPLNVTATGASVVRSVQDHFGEAVNVRDFGALGDGATDDTTAINAAVAAAVAAHKGVFIPAGTYRVSHITYAVGLTGLIGAGREQTILKRIDNDSATNALLSDSASATAGVEIRDLTIDGNKANNTLGGYGILLANGASRIALTNLRVVNVKAAGGYGSGIQIQNTSDGANNTFSFVSGCIASNNDFDGIVLYGGVVNMTVQNCHAANNGDYGIGGSVQTTGANTMYNCKIIGCTILNNKFGTGFGGGGPGWRFDVVQACVIANNVVRGSTYNAIVYQGTYGVVSGNYISDNGTDISTGPAGILFNAVQSSITGNILYNNASFGIDAGGSVDCLIEGNLISGTHSQTGYGGGTAINIGAAQGTTVNDNLLINNVSQPGNEGANINLSQYDFGGQAVPFQSKDVTVSNNTIITPATSNAWGIIATGNIPGAVIRDNVFKGATNSFYYVMNPGLVSVVSGNTGGDPFGYQVSPTGVITYPDFTDTITLTGTTPQTITLMQTNTQYQAAGRVVAITVTNGGSGYTSPPTVTISGDGTGATATCLLDDSGHVALMSVTGAGSNYTTATVAFSGGGGSGAAATAQVGHLPGGRRLTVINNSNQNQTFQNNPTQAMAGGVDQIVPQSGTISFYHNGSCWCEVSNSNTLSASGGKVTGPIEFKSGSSLMLDQGVPVYLTDANGASVYQWIDGGNNHQLVGTSSTGGQRPIWNIVEHSDTSAFQFTVPVNATAVTAVGAVQCGGFSGPTWTTGSTAPSATAPVGSLYSRVGGAVGATLYVSRGGGTWNAVAGV